MANWIKKIHLNPEWTAAQAGTITIQELAKVVRRRLSILIPYDDEYLDRSLANIVETFDFLADDPQAVTEDFDSAMVKLYDFGDITWNGRKALWIDTISPARYVRQ